MKQKNSRRPTALTVSERGVSVGILAMQKCVKALIPNKVPSPFLPFPVAFFKRTFVKILWLILYVPDTTGT